MWLTITRVNNDSLQPVSLLLTEGILLIGRGRKAELSLPDRAVSGKHLEVEFKNNLVSFRDLGSRHGTMHNGENSSAGHLKAGDTLTLGQFELLFSENPSLALLATSDKDNDRANKNTSITAAQLVKRIATISTRLQGATRPKNLMTILLEELVTLFKAQRGFILLKDGASEKLVTVASHLIDDMEEFVSLSSTVYKQAIETRETIIVPNSSTIENNLYALSVQLYTGPRSIICAPLKASEVVYGVVYLDMPTMDDEELPEWVRESWLFEPS